MNDVLGGISMPQSRLSVMLLAFMVALMGMGREATRPEQGLFPAPPVAPTYAYENGGARIEIIRREDIPGTVYYTIEIWTQGPEWILSAFSSDRFDGPRERVPEIAQRNDAILASNGDFATFH